MVTDRPSPMRTILFVVLIACAAAILVSATHEWSRDRIAANERQRLLARLRSVVETLPNAEQLESIDVPPPAADAPALTPTDAFVMTDGGVARAVVLAVTAPDGYNAAIRMLVGIDASATITGVRVVSHRETPGLGDAIEIEKSSWITQFTGASLGQPPVWAVEKDGGPFDSITGATVTPRAVVAAVERALEYYDAHGNELIVRAREAVTRSAVDE